MPKTIAILGSTGSIGTQALEVVRTNPDSIVIVENIERFLRMGYSRKDAAILATKHR